MQLTDTVRQNITISLFKIQ